MLGYNMLRFQAGTASGVHFMAALELASRCSGLVGHFSSGTTRLLYRVMCMHHAGSQVWKHSCMPPTAWSKFIN